MKKIYIKDIKKGSIAEEAGIEAGDFLINIDDQEIIDILDYDFLIKNEYLTVLIEDKTGEQFYVDIEKDFDEELGLVFEEELIDKARLCRNKCVFCFMDQIPDSMRSTLRYKDDDYRLSFMEGNYVTLTNTTREDLNRIIKYRLNPINVSVHTTNGETRKKMLNNKNADKILENIKILADGEITMNCQIVLCPGLNDGEQLIQTIEDLSQFFPNILSVSIVPVGLTKYRDGLYPLVSFDKEGAIRTINDVTKLQKKYKEQYGSSIVFLADEFYILAEMELPDYEHYEDFPQIENGVGMVTSLYKEIEEELADIEAEENNRTLSVITGKLMGSYMTDIFNKIKTKLKGLEVKVYTIENEFFGEKITVAGLITGQDIIKQMKGKEFGERILIPNVMLKSDADIFLDDVTLEEVEKELGVKIQKIGCDGRDLIEALRKKENENVFTDNGRRYERKKVD